MKIQSSDVDERAAEPVLESLAPAADAAWAYSMADIHEAPTLLPPPPDESPESEPPPTARWTPPPALIASARFGGADELSTTPWSVICRLDLKRMNIEDL